MLSTKGLHVKVSDNRARDNSAGPVDGWWPLFAFFALRLACSLRFIAEPPVNADGLATEEVCRVGRESAAPNGWTRALDAAALKKARQAIAQATVQVRVGPN